MSPEDSLACPYPDCLTYIGHKGSHEFSWGGSIPWPPEADDIDTAPTTLPVVDWPLEVEEDEDDEEFDSRLGWRTV